VVGEKRYLPLKGRGIALTGARNRFHKSRIRAFSGAELIVPGEGIPQTIVTPALSAESITDVIYTLHVGNPDLDELVEFSTIYQYHTDVAEPDEDDVDWTDQDDPTSPTAQDGSTMPITVDRKYFLETINWFRLKTTVTTYPFGFSEELFWHIYANGTYFYRKNAEQNFFIRDRRALDDQPDWRSV